MKKSQEELKKILSPEAYKVTQESGTEAPFTGQYTDSEEEGMYYCVCCDIPLFRSSTKFHSGCGWPSFSAAFDSENVGQREDDRYGMRRTEVICNNCEAHLGHVFLDGPPPTGQRFCINSVALDFREE